MEKVSERQKGSGCDLRPAGTFGGEGIRCKLGAGSTSKQVKQLSGGSGVGKLNG